MTGGIEGAAVMGTMGARAEVGAGWEGLRTDQASRYWALTDNQVGAKAATNCRKLVSVDGDRSRGTGVGRRRV